ncbi:MAG: thioredoxin domain-containing protein [Alphaproteobacteria bacterium]|jgi:protein-disulfide isomerase|nr:thioredoxin domain-containing protein [Alphaproteobacteria bacterium]
MRAFVPRRCRFAALAAGALALAGAALMPALTPAPATAQTLSGEERAAIEDVVRNYILENPEIIVEALDILQQREEMAAAQRQRQVIAERADQVFDGGSPFIGNPDGDVVLVEFFDYNCGYCKRMMEPVNRLVAEDSGLKIVMKEFPILAESSMTSARAALAAREQGLYYELHNALMSHRGDLTDEVIFGLAEQVGLDVEQLREDMGSEAVAAEITANMELARTLGVRGTPAFVIGDDLIPGAVGYDALRQAIEAERAG